MAKYASLAIFIFFTLKYNIRLSSIKINRTEERWKA